MIACSSSRRASCSRRNHSRMEVLAVGSSSFDVDNGCSPGPRRSGSNVLAFSEMAGVFLDSPDRS